MTTLLDPRVGRRSLPLAEIVRDPGLQPREALDDATVERYADAMAAGVRLPAVTVYCDGSTYWLADGSHRCAAADRLQRTSIDAEIYRGTRRDALLHALRANTEHGLQRRPGDLRRAVELALGDPEISRESDRQIASICRCSHTYVSQIRKAQSGNSLQMGQAHRVVRRGDQVYKQAVKPTEPEPTEADIAIARDLVAEALGTWTRPVNRGSIYNQVLRLGGGAHTARKAVYTAIDRMIAAGSVLDLKDEHGRRVHALAYDPAIQAARPARLFDRILELLAASPLPAAILCQRLGMTGAAQRNEVQSALALLYAEGRAREYRGMWFLQRAQQQQAEAGEGEQQAEAEPGVPADAAAEAAPNDELTDDCTGDYDYEPEPADQKLPTPTAKDAGRVLDLLKQHAPVPLRMKYIREQLDMGDSDFYRARMLLMGGGEVVQDGESLRLVVKAGPPEPEESSLAINPVTAMLDELDGLSNAAAHVVRVADASMALASNGTLSIAETTELRRRILKTQRQLDAAREALTGLYFTLAER